MATRIYLVPIETNTAESARGPKYFRWRFDPDPPALFDVPWSMIDYGMEPLALLGANVSEAQHILLASQGDVFVIPEVIDQVLGLDLSRVQGALESQFIPADHWTQDATWRDTLRRATAVFGVLQRYAALIGATRLFAGNTRLNSRMNQLSTEQREALQRACSELGYTGIPNESTTTIREVLEVVETQAPVVTLQGIEI